jgi:hypothetical protein
VNLLAAQKYLQNRTIEVLDLYDVQTKHYTWRNAQDQMVGQAIFNHSCFQLKIYQSNGHTQKFFGEEAKDLISTFEPQPAERTLFGRVEVSTCHDLIVRITEGDNDLGKVLAMMHPKTSTSVHLRKMFH